MGMSDRLYHVQPDFTTESGWTKSRRTEARGDSVLFD
jgi:hypothetical protein